MGNGPVDKFQDYPVEVALFEREGENGSWVNAQVSKTYKQDDEYRRTNNFNRTDLLKLNALLPQALTRMQELQQGQGQDQDDPNDMEALKKQAEDRREKETQGQGQDQSQGQGI